MQTDLIALAAHVAELASDTARRRGDFGGRRGDVVELTPDFARLATGSDDVVSDFARLAIDCDDRASDSAELAIDRDDLASDSAELAIDCDDRASDSAELAIDRDDLASDSAELAIDCDDRASDSAELAIDRDELTSDSAQLAIDRDGLVPDSARLATDRADPAIDFGKVGDGFAGLRGPTGSSETLFHRKGAQARPVIRNPYGGADIMSMTGDPAYRSAPSPIELAHRPEIAAFSEWLARYVDTGDGRDELTIATAAVVRLARELRLEAAPIVEALELIGAPPSAQLNPGAVARGGNPRARESPPSR